MYDYYEVVKEDARLSISEALEGGWVTKDEVSDVDKFYDCFYDRLWIDDSVTGNASGSYTFNSAKASEYVVDNLDLLREAYIEFGEGEEAVGKDFLDGEWEAMDVTIRCYVLGSVLRDIAEEYEDEGFFEEEE